MNARDIAVRALRDREGNVSAHLDRLLGYSKLSDQDAALARELALGAVRRKRTLQLVLHAFLLQPDKRRPGALNEILLIGLYQILFLDRVPDFAAVNEAVEQAARFRHKRQSGFVNGVLRTVTRSVSEAMDGQPPAAPDVVPVAPGLYRKAGKDVFPHPRRDPGGYVSAAYSLPPDLAQRWVDRMGAEQAMEVATASNARAPMTLRVNRLRGDVDGVLASLADAGVEAARHANGTSVVLRSSVNVTELEAFAAGLIQPQDATPTSVVHAAAPQSGMKVLDLCASPGTKTTGMAELMNNTGSIVAVDVSAEKLQKIEDNCRRLGVDIVQPTPADKLGSLEPESFDLVLVDAPCSNTGVLSRRAEARWRFSLQKLTSLVRDQQFLVKAGANFVRPGGRLVYSTCSIEPEECGQVTRHAVKNRPKLQLISEELTLPGGATDPTTWRDGGYVAVLQMG